MISENKSLEIVTLTNPLSDNLYDNIKPSTIRRYTRATGEAQEAAGWPDDYHPLYEPLTDEFDTHGEQFARVYAKNSIRLREIDAWQEKLGSWMSKGMSKKGVKEDFREWWSEQDGEHLEDEPSEWWDYRTRSCAVAVDRANRSKLVGAGALIAEYTHERDVFVKPHYLPDSIEFQTQTAYEIRRLTVIESYRDQNIAKRIVRELLRLATMSDAGVPTFAVTTNPVAAKVFESLQGTTNPSRFNGFEKDRSYYDLLACWARIPLSKLYGISSTDVKVCSDDVMVCSDAPPPCNACPKKYETAWWWPTDNKEWMAANLGIRANLMQRAAWLLNFS